MSAENDAGIAARAAGKTYHTDSEEDKIRYHNKAKCPEGLKIEYKHIQAGLGVGRRLCEVCPNY
jgi:hypothetical protein